MNEMLSLQFLFGEDINLKSETSNEEISSSSESQEEVKENPVNAAEEHSACYESGLVKALHEALETVVPKTKEVFKDMIEMDKQLCLKNKLSAKDLFLKMKEKLENPKELRITRHKYKRCSKGHKSESEEEFFLMNIVNLYDMVEQI